MPASEGTTFGRKLEPSASSTISLLNFLIPPSIINCCSRLSVTRCRCDSILSTKISGSTWEEIYEFFQNCRYASLRGSRERELIFVIDQMRAWAELNVDEDSEKTNKAKLRDWLRKFTAGHKAIFSTSANYTTSLQRSKRQ